MNLTTNFTLSELVKSDTALRYDMDNTPGETEIENLRQLCEQVLQPVRDYFQNNLQYTQLILEFYTPGVPDSGWVHVSYDPQNLKKQALTATKQNGKTVYLPGLVA